MSGSESTQPRLAGGQQQPARSSPWPSERRYRGDDATARPRRSAEFQAQASNRLDRAGQRAREELVEALMVAGVGQERLSTTVKEQFPTTNRSVLTKLVAKVRARWADEEKQNRPHNKHAAQRRLFGHIAKAATQGNWGGVASLERLLSDIQGTREPVEVNLNVDAAVTEAVMHVVGNLTPEEMDRIVDEQQAVRAGASPSSLVPAEGQLLAQAAEVVRGGGWGSAAASRQRRRGREPAEKLQQGKGDTDG